jgi:anaerobic selenocysteine-containing dehydrogenase
MGISTLSVGSRTIKTTGCAWIGVSGGGVSHAKDSHELFNEALKGKKFAGQTREIAKPQLAAELFKLSEPPVKMAFINGGNPVAQSPNAAEVKRALSNIETKVVFEQFMTDTAQLADYVLPVTTFLEETDVVASCWHNVIGLVNPVIEARGEARSDLKIYQALSERLGFGDKMLGTPEEWIEKALLPLSFDDINLSNLKIHNFKRVPSAPMVPYEKRSFDTQSGRMKLIQSFDAPQFTNRKYPLVLLSTHTRTRIHSQAVSARETDDLLIVTVHPKTAKHARVKDGDAALIVSPVGELKAKVEFNEKMRENVVTVIQGGRLADNKSANLLTEDKISFAGNNACYNQTAVRLERIR